ncbi:MAG: glycosyltransferase family 4 protein [Chloroflexota bacterium]
MPGIKIGFVIYGSLDTISGGYLYDRKLVEYLRSNGDQVEVISLPWRNYLMHLSDNLNFRLPNGFDILIEDELNHPSLLSANSQKHPYPVISLVHHLRSSEQFPSLERSLYQFFEKKYLHAVDGFIFNSGTTRTVVESLAGSEKPAILAFPPTDRFGAAISPDYVHTRSFSDSPLKVTFLGNVIPRKGLSTVLGALKKITENVTLDVIGSLTVDKVYAEQMQKLTAEYGLAQKVTFHGALELGGIEPILRNSHLMVVPSSYEGFGMVYLEGMCFGLPAIGSTSGAAGEIIQPGKTGYLVDPGDSNALADILQKLAANRILLNDLSQQALIRYAAQPTWEQTAESVRQYLYQQIADWKN